MSLYLSKLTEDMAKEICNWKYDGEYSVYNLPDWKYCVKNSFGITKSDNREKEFLAVMDKDNNLYGHVRLREVNGKVVIGLGLKPSLCGQGMGKTLMNLLVKECNKRYPDKKIRLQVRSFNERAIKCYKKVGFKVIDIKTQNTKMGKDEFVVMEY
ncbi:GNAT family N-acetyltransferase [Dethiothermospora halolimnae]|uniref:GNAT family N-acetyltransferase n=1 Tax=Dethiothermospora halolimnae TaxID=3114390 RepID=UPI003CCBBF8E